VVDTIICSILINNHCPLPTPPPIPPPGTPPPQVVDNIIRGILINVVGMGSTLLGVSTLVGLLVAKTLSNAT
jgi:hypothetical protein